MNLSIGLVFLVCIGAGFSVPQSAVPKEHIGHRNLLGDLSDFIALIPLEDCAAILEDHVQNDPALAAVIAYLQSDAWNNLVDEVLAKSAAKELIQYLNDQGIPVDLIIGIIREVINGAVPGVDPDDNGSLRPFLDELEAVLPIEEFVALLNDKMQNSPDFQALYSFIATPEGKALVDEVLQMEEAARLRQRLTDMGVDVEGVLKSLYEFFGWGDPPAHMKVQIGHRSLLEDIAEFIGLIPLQDCLEILDNHVKNDPALAAIIVYLQSDVWNDLVDEVLTKPAAQDLIEYLNDQGVPVDLILGLIRDIINGATPGVDPDNNGSLRSFLDELEAIIPFDKLMDLLNDKMQNSPDFQALYQFMSSETGHSLVDEVLQMDEAARLRKRLTEMGADVEGVLAAVYKFFGWGTPPAPPKNYIS